MFGLPPICTIGVKVPIKRDRPKKPKPVKPKKDKPNAG
jgi:hypothetical protein